MNDLPPIYIVWRHRPGQDPIPLKYSDRGTEIERARDAQAWADKRNEGAGDSPDRDRYEAVRYVAEVTAGKRGCR
jgi:hypothetical protein